MQRDQSLATYKNAVSEQQVQQQQALVNVDTRLVAQDNAQLQADKVQLGYATITAPIAGRIGVVNVTKGAVVRAADTTPLLTVTQMAPLRVSFTIPERDLDAFRQALASSRPGERACLERGIRQDAFVRHADLHQLKRRYELGHA